MPVFVSKDGKYRAMRRILSWVRGLHMSSRGDRTTSTFSNVPTKVKYVILCLF